MSGFVSDLLAGLAQLLEDAGLGAWRPDGEAYLDGETALVSGDMPQQPHRAVALSGYGVSDSPVLADGTTGVQFRARWDPHDKRGVDDLADAIFDELQNRGPLTLVTGIQVVQIHRQSWTGLGRDGNSRWTRSDNYYVQAHRPTTHRL